MARKTGLYVADFGRDEGKQFEITEMPAAQAEAWAMRAFCLLAQSGVEIPAGSVSMAQLAEFGLKALAQIDYNKAKPLLDEMMACVKFVPKEGNTRLPLNFAGTEIVEEPQTLLKLRVEVWKLHVNF